MDSASPRRVVIVILNWNGRDLLPVCLKALENTDYPAMHVLVVDNGSKDDSVALMRQDFPNVEILQLPENLGYSKGCNAGIQHALTSNNPDFIVLMNNDAKISEPTWLRRMTELADQDPQVGMVSGIVVYPDGRLQYTGGKFVPKGCATSLHRFEGWTPPRHPYEAESVIGAATLLKREMIERIGLLDQGFSPFNYEDFDYCVRARRAGYTILIDPSITVIHLMHASLDRVSSKTRFRTDIRNLVRFRLLNYPLSWLVQASLFGGFNLLVRVFERKDKNIGYRPTNMRLREAWHEAIACYLSALIANAKNIFEIGWKRTHRTEKIWY